MTASDDGSRDEPGQGPHEPRTEPELPFDEEAAWREIVANYGERPRLGGGGADGLRDPRGTGGTGGSVGPGPDTTGLSAFDRSYLDSLDARRNPVEEGVDDYRWIPGDDGRSAAPDPAEPADQADHFVPPEPPPIPRGTPARRLAWGGLLVPPVVLVVAVLLHWTMSMWLSFALVAAFVGGFLFLVATMPRDRGEGWNDGAVL
jgi:hypothetical protein